MKKRNTFETVMHFLVHNGFMFTVAIMCMVHAGLLIIEWSAGVMPLANYNIFSVVVYMFCVLLCRSGHIMTVYLSILFEVITYTVVSIYYIGWECGSFCFLFSIVPIMIYFGCYLFKGYKRWIVAAILFLLFLLYIILYIRFEGVKPVYEVNDVTRRILVVYASFAMVLAMIFYNVLYIYSSESEMTSLEQKNVQLSADAHADALTGLLNRRGFLPKVEDLMKSDRESHFCIAFCDIDNFKRINDSFGHDCGDEVLRHIAGIIKKEMTGCDICRWGGEEIIILMKDYDFEVAKKKMEYIRKYIETTPTVFFNKYVSVTITIGLEEYLDIYHEPEEIIKVADERMYYGKQHGKNIVIFE